MAVRAIATTGAPLFAIGTAMAETLDCAVIGAGVIGLAVARALARGGRDVVVLDAEETIGTGTSSRNSEVIHAGIHYPKDSLKARFCVAGRHALYRFCRDHGSRTLSAAS